MKAKQILYLTYDGLTDPLGQSQILPYIEGLAAEGYHFSILSFEKSHYANQQTALRTRLERKGIDWWPLTYTKWPPVFSTVYDLWRMWQTAKRLHREKKFDLVHCRSYLPALVGMKLKRRYRLKFLFDIRGFWIEERVEGGLWNMNNPLFKWVYAYLKKKEQQLYAEADGIISLTHRAKEEIETKFDPPGKIHVIPCCVDLALFDPEKVHLEDRQALKAQLGIEGERVLIYLGSLGTWYDLPAMLRYFQSLREQQPAKFLIVTPSDPELVTSASPDRNIEKDIIVASARREEVPVYLSLAHQGVFFYREGYSRMACSPTKLGEMMAMGLPVVGNDIGDTARILQKYQAGVVCDAQNPVATEHLLSSEKIIQGAREYFSLSVGILDYATVYQELSGDFSFLKN